MCLKKIYSRPNYGEELVTIGISAEIFRVLDISDKNMEFTVSMEFKQTWNDTRLSFEVGDGTVKEIGVAQSLRRISGFQTHSLQTKS